MVIGDIKTSKLGHLHKDWIDIIPILTKVNVPALFYFSSLNGRNSFTVTMNSRVSLNSLTTIGYLQEVFIRLWIPSLLRISTSAWS